MTNKTKKRLSNAWFWIKHLSLAGILIWAAYYFLYGAMPSFDMRETKNAAAQGLSQFYESFRNRVNDKDLDRDKYVINLGKQTFPLEDALQQRGLVVKPSPVNWKGQVQPRRFDSGDTLKGVLTRYAHDEDIELFWYLEKDYVVKLNFRVDTNFVSTLYQVSRAINDDFEFEVYAFYCHRQRAAVITENPSEFVRTSCRKLES
ncbi:TcpQ domain-containing protein [Pseudoalteromonas xiamenensis]|uniref:TcpQ domain-containing protein n=1 Tax=Pseudoalteromonas xiamenensis TaxID=882626 RepID=A0A975HLV1_9GAMM|nr:TcpQ domain-containing protein [Pseudoalteromonas xiamenensis]QTH72429.1 TcpQ domain-containing protein [Pseudoalteromonas xiamenensis]WMN61043.1 toxin co-regulated pilus biosynthesis Q family protein [Pseudoalteromonas xiamenensis]